MQAGMIIVPGSDYALVMRTVGRYGRVAGVLTALGLGVGALALLVLSIAGIDAVIESHPVILIVIKYVGACWLLFQAVVSFLPARSTSSAIRSGTFVAGFVNHFVNIEMVIFYIAVISQLNASDVSFYLQGLIALEMSIFTVLWFMIIAGATDSISNGQSILNSIAARMIFGALFLFSAVVLVFFL